MKRKIITLLNLFIANFIGLCSFPVSAEEYKAMEGIKISQGSF